MTTRIPKKQYVAEAGYRIVPRVIEGVTISTAVIECAQCGYLDDMNLPRHLPTHVVLAKFKQRGWDCDKPRKFRCPKCVAFPKRGKPQDQDNAPSNVVPLQRVHVADIQMPEPPAAPISETILPPITAIIPTEQKEQPMSTLAAALPPIKIADTIKVGDMLSRYFDPKTGTYADHWNDRRVSEETKVPMVQVIRIREEAFGPLKADPEFLALRTDHAALMKRFEQMLDDLTKFGNRVEAYAAKQGVK